MAKTTSVSPQRREVPTIVRGLAVALLLYCFLTGVELLSGGFKTLGKDFVDGLFQGVSNPIG
nr:sodium dependent phosphate transporter [Acidimicrobiales bacterium]